MILPVVLLVHAALIASASQLPDALAAAVAGTVYAPLWPLSALGLPVQAPAAEAGWSSPTLLGWGIVAALWTSIWALAIAVLTRRRP